MQPCKSPSKPRRLATLLMGAAALCGCATFSSDGGFGAVANGSRTLLGKDVRWPRTPAEHARSDAAVAKLLAHPLGADDAVQIALLNSPDLQASFQELGISEADLVQAGRLPNPGINLRHAAAGGVYDIEEGLTFNVLALVTAPYAHAIEERRFSQMQSAALIEVVRLADRTRAAYFTALAARESLKFAWDIKNAAQTSAELARRMLSAGNWNRVDQVRQQDFYMQAMQNLARAQLADETATAELRRWLGIAAESQPLELSDGMPELPQNIVDLPNLEQKAMDTRIDLKIMQTELDELARRLKLTQATRIINVLDAGPVRVREGTRAAPYETGYEVRLEIPVFDSGAARVRKAEAIYARAVERLAGAALDARTEVRTAAARYRISYEMAVRERDGIMPIQKRVIQQDVLRYNASLISVFELLADARAQIAGVNDFIQSERDFWIAQSHLDTALLAQAAP